MQKILQDRIDRFISDSGVPITRFCRAIGITPQTYYPWRKGETRISYATIQRIEEYLAKFNY